MRPGFGLLSITNNGSSRGMATGPLQRSGTNFLQWLRQLEYVHEMSREPGAVQKFHGDALPVVDWAPTETPRGLQVLKMIASVWLVLIFAIPSSAEAACPPGQDLRTDRSSNGQVKARGCVGRGADGNYRRQGPWTYWYANGQKKTEGAFKDDKKEGPWTYWYVNGQKESEGAYKNGKREGPWTAWYENGQ